MHEFLAESFEVYIHCRSSSGRILFMLADFKARIVTWYKFDASSFDSFWFDFGTWADFELCGDCKK